MISERNFGDNVNFNSQIDQDSQNRDGYLKKSDHDDAFLKSQLDEFKVAVKWLCF